MTRSKSTAPAEAFRLTLVSVPPDQEVQAIKFIKEMCGYRLERAFELVDDLPAVVKEFAAEDDAAATHRLLAKIGAHCKLEHLVDGEVDGEDVQEDPVAEAQSTTTPTLPPQPLAGINELVLLELIEDQRHKLYNLEASLHCVSEALHAEQSGVAGAVELATEEVQRVTETLDRVNLLRAARGGTQAVEEVRAASEAAREARS
jgi:hypothetical protein